MENKINVAELLRNCPKGMEFDCTMFEDVFLERVDENVEYPIAIRVGKTDVEHLTKKGCWNKYSNAKCVIFPKGKTTWEGFVPPCKFKNGDVVRTSMDNIAILGDKIGEHFESFNSYCGLFNYEFDTDVIVSPERFATEEEKQILFNAIKANGYKWNEETKTLEKRLEPKFDLTTLKPFDKVLVRGDVGQKWTHDFFGFIDKDKGYPFVCVGHYVIQCVPYECNEHLLGTTNDCAEYFKTWK